MAQYDLTTLEQLTDTFVSKYKKELQMADKNASGALVNSIEGTVEFDGKIVSVIISGADYWKYVEYGRKPGKFPPVDAILKWIQVRGLPRSNRSIKTGYKGKLPSQNQLAFLIGRKIKQDGIPAGNYLTNLIESTNLFDKVAKYTADMVHQKFIDDVREEINDITVNLK